MPADPLALHTELTRLLAAVPRDGRVAGVIRRTRRIAARLALAEMQGLPDRDPVAAVRRVVELAIQAGADWQAVVAAVNRAGTPGAREAGN